jgi:hypothetical protein
MPIKKLYINPTNVTPEVNFSPEENIFLIRGISSPEDVRALYNPVFEWVKKYIDDLLKVRSNRYTLNSPLKFTIDLTYFNSSTAKFLYDIFLEMKRLIASGIPFCIEWFFEEDDPDQKEAGADISLLVGLEFTYVEKKNIRL